MLKTLRRFADARTVEGRIVTAILVVTLALMAWDVNALRYAMADEDSVITVQSDDAAQQEAEEKAAAEAAAKEAAEREAAEKSEREAAEKAAAEKAAAEKAAAEKAAAEKAAAEKAAAEKAAAEKAAAEKAAAEKAAAEKAAAEKAAAEKKAAEEKASKDAKEPAAKDNAKDAGKDDAAPAPTTKEPEPAEQPADEPEAERLPAAVLLGKAGDITVKVDAPEGALPEGAQLRVYRVPADKQEAADDKNADKLRLPGITAEELAQRVQDEVGKKYADYLAIDVSLVDKDSIEVQPRKKVAVTFADTDLDGSKVTVYRIDEEKVSKVKTLEADVDTQSFETKDPAIYFVGATAKKVEAATPAAQPQEQAPTVEEGQAADNQEPAQEPKGPSSTTAEDGPSSSSTEDEATQPGAEPVAPAGNPSSSTTAGEGKPASSSTASTSDGGTSPSGSNGQVKASEGTQSSAPEQEAPVQEDPAQEVPVQEDPVQTGQPNQAGQVEEPAPMEPPAAPAEVAIQVNYLDMDGNPLPDVEPQTITAKPGSAYTVSTERAGYTLNRIERDGADQGRRVNYVAQEGDAAIDVYYQVNVKVAAKDKTREYNGRALFSQGLEDVEATGLRDGHVLASISFDGYQTYVGSSPTTPKGARVSGPQSADYYLVSYEAGTLTVTAPAADAAAQAPAANQEAPLPVDPALPTLSLTAESGGGVYSGQPYGLNNVRASVADAVLEYKVGDGAWSTQAPTVKNVLDSMDGTVSVRATHEGYNYAQVDGLSIVVTPRAATVVAQDAQKVYGDVDPLFKAEVSGLVNDEPSNVVSYWFERTPGEDVGEYEIVPKAEAQQGNYELSFRSAKLRIQQAPVVVTPDAASKVYGQDDPEALVAAVTGLKFADTDDAIDYTVSRRQGQDAGIYEITAQGERSQGNYQVEFETGTFTIQKAPVRVTAQDAQKTFGTADPALVADVSGLIGDDQLAYTVSREEGENAGTYAIKVEGAAEQGNYAIEFIPGTFTVNRVKATVVAADATKRYGEADPACTIIVKGLPEGISGSDISYTAAREPGESVGTYALTVEGAQVQGNYELAFEPGALTIEPAIATVVVDDASKTYGDADPAFDATVQGLKNGETAKSAGISFTLSRAVGEAAGEYAITATGAARQGNYELAFEPGTLAIGKAHATVIPMNSGKAAGEAEPQLAAVVTGLKGADTAADIAYTLSRVSGEDAGTYKIEAAGQAEQGNYEVAFGTADFTVVEAGKMAVFTTSLQVEYTGASYAVAAVPSIAAGTTLEYSVDGGQTWTADVPARADAGTTTVKVRATNDAAGTATAEYAISVSPKQVVVRADDAQKVYGEDDPVFVYRVNGLVEGDRATLVRVSDVSREAGEDAGTYAITPVGRESQDNYQVAFEAGTFTINPRAVTVRGDDASKVYGQEDPGFTATVEGLLDGDSSDAIAYEVKRSDADDQNVGVYAVMPLGTAVQGNYAVTYIAGSFTILRAQATVAANAAQKAVGEADPELTATVEGLQGDDTLVYTVSRQPGEEPGSYAIAVNGEADQGNYSIEYVGGTFVIGEAAQDEPAEDEPAPAEEPEQAAAEPATPQVFTDQFEDADGNVTTVTVEASADAFPQGTTMEAKPVRSEDVRDRVEAAIDDPAVRGSITNMVAVDITFFDAEGNQIEPAGEVSVRISSNAVDEMRDPLLVHVPDAL